MESPIHIARYDVKYSWVAECARLRSEENRKQPSVAEAVKKFGGTTEPKKASPIIRRTPRSTEPSDKVTQKATTRSAARSRKDSASDKKEEKKPLATSSSTPKHSKSHKSQEVVKEMEENSGVVTNGTASNALDAIKMWENKTTGKDSKPSPAKKPLSLVKSTPALSTVGTEEDKEAERSAKESSVEKDKVNGLEDKPVADTSTADNKENEEEKEEAKLSVPARQSHSVSNMVRSRQTTSMVETKVSPTTGKRGFTPPVVEKCHVCKKTVYTVERLKADDKIYHKNCFKCSYCKKVVGTGTYAANKGEIFCKTHFKMLFKIKGNYDEGFGREQHKKKWASGAQGEEGQTAD